MDEPTAGDLRRRRLWRLGLSAAALLALGLSLRGLTRHGLWLDEAYAVAVARPGRRAAPGLRRGGWTGSGPGARAASGGALLHAQLGRPAPAGRGAGGGRRRRAPARG